MNLTPQSVSKWETDLSAPDIMLLPKLAKILDVSLEELLTGEKKVETKVLNEFDYTKAILKILVNSADGDEVTINLPIALGETIIKAIIKSNVGDKNDKDDLLKQIDFEQIIELVKKGIIGEIVNVKSADGDIVIIRIEY